VPLYVRVDFAVWFKEKKEIDG